MIMKKKATFVSLFCVFIISIMLPKNVNAITSWNYPENHCLSFDGVDDHIACNALDSYNVSKFTIEFWMKPKHAIRNGSDQVYGHHYGSIVSCGDGWTVEFDYKWGELIVGIKHRDIMTAISGGRQSWETSWHHIAIVYDPDLPDLNLKVYVNGTLDWNHGPDLGTINFTFTNMKIGKPQSEWFAQWTFGGLIDEVRYWNVCRSSLEIDQSRDRILDDSELNSSELLGYWRFDEGIGTLSQDYSSYHNDALLATSPSDPSWVDYGAPIVPEFATCILLQLFIIATLIAITTHKKKNSGL